VKAKIIVYFDISVLVEGKKSVIFPTSFN